MDSSRSRRVNPKKESRLQLLKNIREAKERGERYIVETEEKPVYETVDEVTYSKIVQERIEDDWIVDDNGLGYADDGREIFDDHDGDLGDCESSTKPSRSCASNKKRLNPDLRPSVSYKCGSKDIRNLFASAASRQTKRTVDIAAQDAALDDLLAELNTDAPLDPPIKKSRTEHNRKSLVEKRAPKSPVARRDTSYTVKSRPPPSSFNSTKNLTVKTQCKDNKAEKISLVKQNKVVEPVIEVKQEPKPDVNDSLIDEEIISIGDQPIELESQDMKPTAYSAWINEEGENAETSHADVSFTVSNSDVDSDSLRFFWLDAYEDPKNQQGVVFLFGKICCEKEPSGFCSCCIRVKDLDRRVFFLPRPSTEYTVKDVYGELRELSGVWKLGKFKCKPTTKKYCFEHADVPVEAEYLEVRFAASHPPLPHDLTGKTFSRVFGSSASFLENLILDLHLRGPCWLEVNGATLLQPQVSWCKVDYDFSFQHPNKILRLADVIASRGENLPQPSAPPIRMVALDVKSVVRKSSNSAEIISVGLLIDNHFYLDKPAGKKAFQSHYLVIAPPKEAVLPYDFSKRLPSWGPQYQPPSNSDVSCGVDVEPNERALLGRLLTRIHRFDPDLLVGHDLWGNQLDLLVHRLIFHKVAHWHRIGRLRRSANFSVNFNRSWFMRHALPGRLVCDTRISSRELVRSRTYNLSELAFQILGGDANSRRQIPASVRSQFASSLRSVTPSTDDIDGTLLSGVDLEVDSADLRCLFLSASGVKELIDFCLSDALLILRLAHQLQVLPLAHQITSICGNVLSRTLVGGRSERNDALLLHAFTEQGYLLPESSIRVHLGRSGKDDLPELHGVEPEGRRKPAYTGGLVLDPKVGFYDTYILLLDFNSLYPSIIQEFNLCFTTMDRSFIVAKDPAVLGASNTEDLYISALISSVTQSGGSKSVQQLPSQQHLPTSRAPGILPSEVRRLVESRKEVKKLIATAAATTVDTAKVAQWNIRQQALKITANSVYGCLGFSASRFCARGLAALVTGLGRALLVNTKELVESMKLDVVYGDTDSIMVNTNSTDLLSAIAIGDRVKHEVNRRYRLVELDIDGVFAAMLLLAKKKYAALTITRPIQYAEYVRQQQPSQQALLPPPPTKIEMKGLDIVRRDWCRLATEVGNFCIKILFSGRATSEAVVQQIHDHLRYVSQQVREGNLPITDFVITKMLTKNPEDYPEAKSQPHVQVALRFNQHMTSGGGSGHRFRVGDTVEYVICNDGTSRSAVQRAYSPAQLSAGLKKLPEINATKVDQQSEGAESKEQERLKIDVHYYLANQIHPVVSRLVALIEGTSSAHIADCLGLDSTAYRHSTAAATATGAEDALQEGSDSGSMFSGAFLLDANPLILACLAQREGKRCTGKAQIRNSPFTQAGLATWVCPECGEGLLGSERQAIAAVNQLILQARAHVLTYEVGTLVCEDPTCAFATRTVSCPPTTSGSEGLWAVGTHQQQQPMCPLCGTGHSLLRLQQSEVQLYRQMIFYRNLLLPPISMRSTTQSLQHEDSEKSQKLKKDASSTLLPIVKDTLELGLRHVRRYLAESAFAMVDLGQIFAGLRTVQHPSAVVPTAITST